MSEKREYSLIGDKWVLYDKLPCVKCQYRYAIVCPMCDWNRFGQYDTYSSHLMTEEEAKEANRKLKEKKR